MTKLSIDKALLNATSHAQKGDIEEAQKVYQIVLQAFPKNKRAQQGLAALNKPKKSTTTQGPPQDTINQLVNLYNQGQLAAAAEQAQALTEQYPKAFIVWNTLGAANKGLGKTIEASRAFKKVTELNPTYADGYSNRGVTLQDQGKLEEAIEAYNKALALKPDYAEVYSNMGNALQEQGKLGEAIDAYNKALSLKPDYAEAYSNMGIVLQDQGKLEEAIASYNKALALKPDYTEAYNNMGVTLKEQGKLEEAIASYNKALALKPDYAEARTQKLHLLAKICDWNSIREDSKLIPDLGTSNEFVEPFTMLSLEDAPERHRLRSEIYAKARYPQKPLPLPAKPLKKPERLRIGYFSADFKEHPVAHLIAKALEQHNRLEFEVFGYSLHGSSAGNMRQRLKNSFDCFTDVQGMNEKEIALLARQDKIDVAIDLNGYTQNSRTGVFAYRAAPIQINYLGYPGTLGVNFMDYIIADQTVIPDIQKSHYSENIIHLPDSYMPQDNTRRISNEPISKAGFGLPEHGFVFCCFNNSFKISPQEFDIWMRLLNKIEGSVLWLLKANEWSENNLRNEASKRGVDADRLVFADKLPLEEHLGRLRLADLFLDTFNFNAHTTASDALWAGIPVVTKIGKSFAARVAGSLLTAIELPELITTTEKEYEALALSLATDPNKFTTIKKKLSEKKNSASLFDTQTYTKNLERAYIHAYQRYADGLPPAEFKVL